MRYKNKRGGGRKRGSVHTEKNENEGQDDLNYSIIIKTELSKF